MSVDNGRGVFSVAEAARYLGISDDTVYRLIKKKKLPNVRLGSRLGIPQFTLDRWLEGEAARSLAPD